VSFHDPVRAPRLYPDPIEAAAEATKQSSARRKLFLAAPFTKTKLRFPFQRPRLFAPTPDYSQKILKKLFQRDS
jgi:hypothetical protein